MESVTFGVLFFILPFIFYPNTSEIFELNKIVVLYLFTIFISATHLLHSAKLVQNKSKLYPVLLLFLLIQSVSTLFSVDLQTSIFGYYGRFNGGLFSIFAYSILFFVYANSQNKDDVRKHLKIISTSAVIISAIAIFEHFDLSLTCLVLRRGLSTSCWSQNLQARAFATFGQPNWLAAFLAAASGVTTPLLIPVLFLGILFTRSRSGLLGFVIAYTISWLPKFKNKLNMFIILNLILVSLFVIFNPLRNITDQKLLENPEINITPSSEIRKLVWIGSIKAWGQKPIIGWGPETFAFAYQAVRPAKHNLTSEWNFTYNKAHNEYLNYLTTTGLLGLGSYLIFLAIAFYTIYKSKNHKVLAAFVSILITNFFGFSTVTTNLYLFILVAMGLVSNHDSHIKHNKLKLNVKNLLIISVFVFTSYSVINLWRADFYYAKAIRLQNPLHLEKAIKIRPRQNLYLHEKAYLNALVNKSKLSDIDLLNTQNYKHLEIAFNTCFVLSKNNSEYLNCALDAINKLIKYSPNYAKYYYLRGLTYLRMNNKLAAKLSFKQALNLKPDYENAILLLNSNHN